MRQPGTALLFLLVLGLPTKSAPALDPAAWTLSVEVNAKRLEGFPIHWSDEQVCLLERDGRMVEFATGSVGNFKKTSSSFQPYSAGEMRAQLERELNPMLEVTGTGHYLVAHPKGQGSKWAQRFEDLYRSMMHYLAVRGFKIREPEFPLTAIVWNKREDFLRYAASEGANLPPGVIGYYSTMSNRITLYDMGGGKADAEAWKQNASTIVHEATHQTAFNTGIHRRLAETPQWVVEGLGTLFEAPGVWESERYRQLEDRINSDRLTAFKQYLKAGRPTMGFVELVADDRLFRTRPLDAYAEAWALTFYLNEKEPRKYGEFLAKMGSLVPFENYSSQNRIADFKAIFGNDLRMLEAHYLRFIEGLK